MANGIRTGDLCGFNKGHSSKFHEGSRVRQTPEEGWRIYRPKRCGNNNKDEDNSPKTLNDKNQFFCNAQTCIEREKNITDKQINESKSISFKRNNTLTENKTNKQKIVTIRSLSAKILQKRFSC